MLKTSIASLATFPKAPAVERSPPALPILATTLTALAQIPAALPSWLQLAVGWMLAAYGLGIVLDRHLGLEPWLAWGAARLLLGLGLLAADAAWLRHLLLAAEPRGWLAPLDRRGLTFVGRILLLGLLVLLLAALPPLATGFLLLGLDPAIWHPHPLQPVLAATTILALALALLTALRLGPWVTAAALGEEDLDPARCLERTRASIWRLLAVTGLLLLVTVALLALVVDPLLLALAMLLTGSADPLFGAGVPLPSAGGPLEPGPLALDLLAMALPALACHLPLQSLAAEIYRRLVWSPAAR